MIPNQPTKQPTVNQQLTNNQPSINQQSTTTKQLNNDNNENNDNKKVRRFAPPTIDEVKQYCLERKNNVDAIRFINYYESNGWMVGKNKMKDWRAAVRTWEGSTKTTQTTQTGEAATRSLAGIWENHLKQ